MELLLELGGTQRKQGRDTLRTEGQLLTWTRMLLLPWLQTQPFCGSHEQQHLHFVSFFGMEKGTLSRIWSFISHLLLFRIWIMAIVVVRLLGALLVGTTNYQGFFIAFHFFPMFSDCYNNIINNHNNIWNCILMVYNFIS